MRGRAPSCMATMGKSWATASTPCRADSWRMLPDGTNSTGVTRPYGSTARLRYSSQRASGHTMTILPTQGTASNACRHHDIRGLPQMGSSCLPPWRPKRSPDPPATMTAATLAFLPTTPRPEVLGAWGAGEVASGGSLCTALLETTGWMPAAESISAMA